MDKRIIKTKRAIFNALLDLLVKKDIQDITITDISRVANVNRKTIYTYYKSVNDILEDVEDTLVKSFDCVIETLGPSISVRNFYGIFEKLTEVLTDNLDYFGKVAATDLNLRLGDRIMLILLRKVKATFIEDKICPLEDVDFVCSYVIYGALSAYKNWYRNGMTIPLKEFSKKVSKLVFNGVDSFLKK